MLRKALNLDSPKACKGLNCNSLDESKHSKDCQDEHSKAYGFIGDLHGKLVGENKLMRDTLNAIASMSTDRKSIQVATEALEQIK